MNFCEIGQNRHFIPAEPFYTSKTIFRMKFNVDHEKIFGLVLRRTW